MFWRKICFVFIYQTETDLGTNVGKTGKYSSNVDELDVIILSIFLEQYIFLAFIG